MTTIRPGLERIAQLLANTDLPWRAIHVGGTNGKGSVSAYISAMLQAYNASEYRTLRGQTTIRHGRFTSPHFAYRHDGIVLDQETIPLDEFAKHEAWFRNRNAALDIGASDFEVLTATAFRYFSHPGRGSVGVQSTDAADLAVIEVGMGGRDDATNILGQHLRIEDPQIIRALPLVTAFTKIGLDHQGFLGETIEEITRNKAGIMKPDVPVIFDESNEEAVINILTDQSGERLVQSQNITDIVATYDRTFSKERRNRHLLPHVLENLSVAFKSTCVALSKMDRLPLQISKAEFRHRESLVALLQQMLVAARHTSFPGRLQYIDIVPISGYSKTVLLDGAHNPQSAVALDGEVRKIRTDPRSGSESITWILAATDTKDIRGILAALLRDGDLVFPVEFSAVESMPWVKPMSVNRIAEAVQSTNQSVAVKVVEGALPEVLKTVSQQAGDKPVVIAGSLYLVGDVLRLLEST